MFFVAFLTNPEVNVIIPIEWVYEHEKQWQKFINSGLNSNQTHRIFYTENPEAYDGNGVPINNMAHFDHDAVFFPDEGCYTGNIIKFFCKSY